jgi:hypothetical protein
MLQQFQAFVRLWYEQHQLHEQLVPGVAGRGAKNGKEAVRKLWSRDNAGPAVHQPQQ